MRKKKGTKQDELEEGAAGQIESRPRGTHIKKRALRNKALSVSFNEKDLKDYVTGFHKRKKKRRKEAKQQLEEVARRKRIEKRKQRKLEKEYVYGGAQPATDPEADECIEDGEQDEEGEPVPSVSGTMMYDNGDTKVTVTTTEITREESILPVPKAIVSPIVPKSVGVAETRKHKVPVKKKPFKRVSKNRSRGKTQTKRDKKKGKEKNKKAR